MFDIANNTEFLTALGINDAPEDVKTKLIAGIEDLAQQRLVVKLSERLSEDQAEEFGNITDEEQAKNWLAANVPDFESIVTDVLSEIRYEILRQKSEVVG